MKKKKFLVYHEDVKKLVSMALQGATFFKDLRKKMGIKQFNYWVKYSTDLDLKEVQDLIIWGCMIKWEGDKK
jgi:hypothetical protein